MLHRRLSPLYMSGPDSPPFQNGRKLLGDKAQAFRRLPFSPFTGKERFPSLLLVAVYRVEKCSAAGAKRSSYRTCLTAR